MSVQRSVSKTGSAVDSVTIEPGWADWRARLEKPNTSEEALADRAMLAVPTDRPVLLSGHQPIVFHPGIAAKLAAMMIAAERSGSAALWIVPDQDAVDPMAVRVPQGFGGSLTEQTIRLAPPMPLGVASASLPSVKTIDEALPGILQPLRDRLLAHADEPTLARQVALATIPLAAEWLGVQTPMIVFASEMMKTLGVRGILEKIQQDPIGAISAYNNAVRAHPGAGVRPLIIDGDRVELPLWRSEMNTPRRAVFADELGSIPECELLPRGLLMTGGARRTLGELFIHGIGGWAYDKITERWLSDWFGSASAPITLVSATQRLELFETSEAVDPDKAVWRAHHARHNPAILGDAASAGEKRSLVERIGRAKGEGVEPSALFGELQRLLEGYRQRHADELARLDRLAGDARKNRDALTLAMDRTWPFVNFNAQGGYALSERVRAAMG